MKSSIACKIVLFAFVFAAASVSLSPARDLTVAVQIFSMHDAEALKFLKESNPVGNPDQGLGILEERAEKVGEAVVTVASGRHGSEKNGGVFFEVEPTLSTDGVTVSMNAVVSLGSAKIIGQCLSTSGGYRLLGVGAAEPDSVYFVMVISAIEK